MFKIFDRRGMFYQWDLDRKLIVLDNSISMVHFSNGLSDTTLDCETYRDGDITLVNVPNILLQQAARITAFAYDDNHTKYSTVFAVIDRPKPADYIYTETEVKNYEKLKNLVYRNNDDLSHLKDEFQNYYDDYSHTQMSVASIEDDYYRFVRPQLEAHTAAIEELKENGVDVDLTDYATKEYVDEAIANLDIPEDFEGIMANPELELLNEFTLTEDVSELLIDTDKDGNPFVCDVLVIELATATDGSSGEGNSGALCMNFGSAKEQYYLRSYLSGGFPYRGYNAYTGYYRSSGFRAYADVRNTIGITNGFSGDSGASASNASSLGKNFCYAPDKLTRINVTGKLPKNATVKVYGLRSGSDGVVVDLTGYYTKEEVENLIKASKVAKPLELIESITLTEEVERIVRTQDTNGNPYNFEKLIIKMANTKSSRAGAVNIMINNSINNVLTIPSAIDGSKTQYSTGTIWVENQTLFYQGTNGIGDMYTTSSLSGMAYGRPVNVADAIIKQIDIVPIGQVLASGSKIDIWGVRADA